MIQPPGGSDRTVLTSLRPISRPQKVGLAQSVPFDLYDLIS